MLLPLQGVNTMIIRVPQGVASLALGYVLLPFQGVCIIGCTLNNVVCIYPKI